MSHDAPSKTKSPLRQLVDIISASVDQIDATFETSGIDYPSIDAPFDPTSPSEAKSMSPEVRGCASLIVAACAQLSATVHIPMLELYNAAGGFHLSSALRASLESNTVEILRESPDGLHVRDIATKNGMDPRRLARVLRLLATHHIFNETSPDVFKNNRLSSMLDTLKTVEEIQAKPEEKHVGTPGTSAVIEHTCDEMFKSSAFLTEVLTDPVMGFSDAVEHRPMALAFQSNSQVWEWYEKPGNEHRLKRFMAAMEGTAKFDPPNAILEGFKWGDLPAQSLIVDVGGGIGHTVKKIREAHPNLKCVVQDRPAVIEKARTFWEENFSSALSDGFVSLEAHDFFKPQPILDANVFICRMIVHDYGHSKAKVILRNLRNAASPDTKLLIIEQIVPYAADSQVGHDIPGVVVPRPPAPLLPNLGKANAIAYLGDFQMFVMLGGEERTVGVFIDLLKDSGWKMAEAIYIPGSSFLQQILAVPI